jgi:hypothetical protein
LSTAIRTPTGGITVGEISAPLQERPTRPTENDALKGSPPTGISPSEPQPTIAETIGSTYGLPVASEKQLKSVLETSRPLAPPAAALGAPASKRTAAMVSARMAGDPHRAPRGAQPPRGLVRTTP